MWVYTLIKIILAIIAGGFIYNLIFHAEEPLSGSDLAMGKPLEPQPRSLTAAEVYDNMMKKMRDGK
jgi:hypothetical protein